MFPDTHILDRRLQAVHELPWCIPASVVLKMSDEDLDRLAAADEGSYWRVLRDVVDRITAEVERG